MTIMAKNPTRGLTFGLCLFVAGLLCLDPPAKAWWQSVQQISVSAPASGSAWGDSGTNVTKSTTTIANDTATGVANSFSSVRGTQAYSAGLHYFEVKFPVAPAVANLIIGLMDATTANGAAMDDRLLTNSGGHLKFNGDGQGGGVGFFVVNLGALWTLANNDIMGLAVDHTNQFWYLHKNCTYFLSGDPTSGPTGTGHVGNGAMAGARPMLSLWGTPVNSGTAQLVTAAPFTCTKPAGYADWNYLLKRDMPGAANDNNIPMWTEQAA